MQYLNSPLLAVITLIGFIWLAHASLHREVSYDHSVFDVLPKTLGQRQADALQDLYSITDDEVSKPVRLFGN